MPTKTKIKQSLISEDVEGLEINALKKAFRRYKNDTSKFRNKNIRDPIDHLDFELNIDNELTELRNSIESGDYHPKRPLIHYAPKKNGISRPTVSLHIEDTIVYRFCIESIDKEIIEITRQKNIRGGVMASPTSEPEDGEYYEKWFQDWMEHNDAIKRALDKNRFIATTDIASYFDNIDIEVLIDMLREAVKGKRNLISLLSLFLHGIKLRYTYATRLNTGLVQDDSDGSRILAYFFLHPHDIRMINFTKQKKGHFFRYVDDMNIIVNSVTDAKLALKTLTDSLRKLGLTASIEKTVIADTNTAVINMRYAENAEIQKINEAITERLRQGGQTKILKKQLEQLYTDFIKRGLDKDGVWIKLLKRFYTLATIIQADFLLNDIENHLVQYPILAASGKLQRYILANRASRNFEIAILAIINYCDSLENLYPQAETALIELLSNLDVSTLSIPLSVLMEDLASRMCIENLSNKVCLCEFSQGVAAYLLFACNTQKATEIGQQYINTREKSEYVRKCWALIGLASKNSSVRKGIIKRLRSETSIEMSRLSYMITNIKKLRRHKVLKRYCSNTKFFLWSDEWTNEEGNKSKKIIQLQHIPIRIRILRGILSANR